MPLHKDFGIIVRTNDKLIFILQPKKQCAAMKIELRMDVLILEMMATGSFPDFCHFFLTAKILTWSLRVSKVMLINH